MNRNILNDLLNTQGHFNEDELNAYLSGNAPADLRHKVENSMLDDPLFSDAVEGYQEMGMSAVPALEDFSEFKKKLPALEEGAKVIRLTPAQKFLRIAAVAAVLLLGIIGYNTLQSPTPDSLYSDFYTHYENDISLTRRGEDDGLNKDFKKALGQYAVGEFSSAMPSFEKALAAEPNNDAAHFFAGMAYMELNRYKDAIQHLDIAQKGKSTYAQKAYWYSILATLKSGDVENAKNMLEGFVKTSRYKNEDAKKLLNKF